MNPRPALRADPPAGAVDWAAPDSTGVEAGDVRAFTARIDEELDDLLATEVEDEWMRGVIGSQLGLCQPPFEWRRSGRRGCAGKRIRPLLALLCFESALVVRDPPAGNPAPVDLDEIATFAAAVELVHNFTLVHDDIMDGDRLRRGRPTLWTVCGEAQALNLGDCMHALAYSCLSRMPLRGVEQSLVGALVSALARTTVGLTVGQRRDLAYEDDPSVDAEMYAAMAAGKTAGLISCSAFGGALLALGDRGRDAHRRTTSYAEFGHHLGLCFQVRDDILGIWGDAARTGKPNDGDVRRRKKTLPIVLAQARAAGEAGARLRELYALPGELNADEEREVRAILDECAAQELAQQAAELQAELAQRALTRATDGIMGAGANRSLTKLRELTASLTARAS